MVEGGTFDGKMNHGYSLRVDTLFTQSVNHIIRPSRIHFLLLEGVLVSKRILRFYIADMKSST